MGPVRIKSQSPQGRFQGGQEHSAERVEREGRPQPGGAGARPGLARPRWGLVGLDVHGPPSRHGGDGGLLGRGSHVGSAQGAGRHRGTVLRAEAGSMEGQLAACVVLDFLVAASDKEKETEEIHFTNIF